MIGGSAESTVAFLPMDEELLNYAFLCAAFVAEAFVAHGGVRKSLWVDALQCACIDEELVFKVRHSCGICCQQTSSCRFDASTCACYLGWET